MPEVIRKTTGHDVRQLAEIHLLCFPDSPWTEPQLQSSLSLESSHGFLMEKDGIVSGFILIQQMGDEAEILTFAVHPSLQGLGLGHKLLKTALAEHPTATTFFLEVAEDNIAAKALYEKESFKINGVRPRYYKRPCGYISAICYRLSRSPSPPL